MVAFAKLPWYGTTNLESENAKTRNSRDPYGLLEQRREKLVEESLVQKIETKNEEEGTSMAAAGSQ